jgi:hypothetical protein
MKICFYAPDGEQSDLLRRSIENAVRSPIVHLGQSPPSLWKEAIAGADLVIVDVTASNPSACYRAGIADALAKRTILISPIQETIPTMFSDRLVIVHHWNLDFLQAELQKIVSSNDSQPSQSPAQLDADTPEGKFQQLFGDLLRTHGYVHRGPVEFDESTFTLREQEMELALVQEIARRAKSLNLRVRLL